MKNENIANALGAYNKLGNTPQFAILDALILDTIISGAYTTDAQLATCFMCSERTIKRSINKLCDFGFITKHLAHDNAKSLGLQQDVWNAFLDKYIKAGDL